MGDNQKCVDVDYYQPDEEILYPIRKVTEILQENMTTTRYWSDQFEEINPIQRKGRNRYYTKDNIEKLLYIKNLLNDTKLTIPEARKFIKKEISQNKNLSNVKTKYISNQQLSQQIENIKNDIIQNISININKYISQELKNNLDNTKTELKDYIAITLEENLKNNSNDINKNIENIKQNIEENFKINLESLENKDIKLVNDLKKSLEDHKKQNQLFLEQQKKKSFWSKIFKK